MSFFYFQDPKAFQYQSGVENTVWELALSANQTGIVTNAPLHSPLLPAGTLLRNGEMARCFGIGSHIGNVGNKTLVIRANGVTTLGTFFLPPSAGALGWFAEIGIRRFSNTVVTITMTVYHSYNVTAASGNTIAVLGTTTGFSLTPQQDLLIEFLATLTGAGDSIGQTLSGVICF
jgi:hypothetical protein